MPKYALPWIGENHEVAHPLEEAGRGGKGSKKALRDQIAHEVHFGYALELVLQRFLTKEKGVVFDVQEEIAARSCGDEGKALFVCFDVGRELGEQAVEQECFFG